MVFTKPARPGEVKTRLIGELSAEQTAALHQAFLDDLVVRLKTGRHAVWLAWALDAEEDLPASSVPGVRQSGEDLGARLQRALGTAALRYPLVAAVGSDHPEMPLERVEEAFERLASGGADVVIGPADDGGYYLIAARPDSLHPAIFEGIEWSTREVLGQTLERCARLGLEVHQLAVGHDVDTPRDLPRLASFLSRNPEACPRTRELFLRWGLVTAA